MNTNCCCHLGTEVVNTQNTSMIAFLRFCILVTFKTFLEGTFYCFRGHKYRLICLSWECMLPSKTKSNIVSETISPDQFNDFFSQIGERLSSDLKCCAAT